MSLDTDFSQLLDRIETAEEAIEDDDRSLAQVEATVEETVSAIDRMEARLEPD